MVDHGSSSDPFLQGQGIPVALRDIETTLEQLWGPAAERVGGPEPEHPHVTRIVLANLVVERLCPKAVAFRPVIEDVITRYPCRAIVVRGADDPERKINAEVSALCHLPDPGLPQVCSERIVLHTGPNAVDLVAGSVRPLLEADLPMVLWWTTDPQGHEALFRDLGDECSRLILDLPDPGTSAGAIRLGLDPAICPFARDTAWYGLTRWRELVAQFFDPPCHHETLNRIDSLRIDAVSPDPSRPPRMAVWLTAWLAGQLGWKRQGQPVKVSGESGSSFRAAFLGPMGTLAVEIVTRAVPESLPGGPCLLGVTLTARGPEGVETFCVNRPAPESPDVRIQARAPDYCRLPSMVRAPELDHARRVAAALEASRVDRPFEMARPIALWLLDHS
ncbi:MAG: glucose-6-phosphate dehydrogenase assembly protein OpcA [Isosphaeraceae bacterium]